ncbi:MAG: 50S ribosomal protein L23 [Verrucomicrobia bacterium]|nr:MAG: 50S ribosomal protein L23 [Verrucomicrobiota bacterium]
MVSPDKILKTLRLTEKSNRASSELNQYTFEVFPSATKTTVKEAVEQTFSVTVTRVNIINVKGKPTRSRRGIKSYKSDIKKAIVTLKEGDKIELV